MNNQFYIFSMSFESGKQINYEDVSGGISISDTYKNDLLLRAPGDFVDEIQYTNLLKMLTNNTYSTGEEYANFKNFCEQILKQMEIDVVSNFIIKDNFGNVYYNILQNKIAGINIEGITE